MPAPGEWLTTAGWLGAALGTAVYLTLVMTGRRHERCVRRRGARLTNTSAGKRIRGRLGRWARCRDSVRLWAVLLAVWAAGWVLVGGVAGCGAGLLAAYGVRRWWRSARGRDPAGHEAEAALIARQLPITADLLASCLSAGAGPREAAEAVGESVAGPVGERLTRTAAEIFLGGEPDEAWRRFGELPGAAPLARCLARATSTGAPAAEPVSRLAEEIRAERASAAVARAQRAGVLITAPVGLCFLPAFLAVGVAPVVIGLATGLSRSG
ncbi:type II secretion system F family protein [Streptomyces sp. JH34]|uniref:type II secretion system F family protein n=1 Tax=Streptomyces sp. JH34 TaxID=2793633 RepID=UPI0023F9A49F|nr:type II secretion system F family protein [Streptomyces sp. JH34]MDF6020248.1 type II secretion system F family protein [Streptomyces sp. JH34]